MAAPLGNDANRLDGTGHWPFYADSTTTGDLTRRKQRRCVYAKCPCVLGGAGTAMSHVKCLKCDVFLCCNGGRNCFLQYHQAEPVEPEDNVEHSSNESKEVEAVNRKRKHTEEEVATSGGQSVEADPVKFRRDPPLAEMAERDLLTTLAPANTTELSQPEEQTVPLKVHQDEVTDQSYFKGSVEPVEPKDNVEHPSNESKEVEAVNLKRNQTEEEVANSGGRSVEANPVKFRRDPPLAEMDAMAERDRLTTLAHANTTELSQPEEQSVPLNPEPADSGFRHF